MRNTFNGLNINMCLVLRALKYDGKFTKAYEPVWGKYRLMNVDNIYKKNAMVPRPTYKEFMNWLKSKHICIRIIPYFRGNSKRCSNHIYIIRSKKGTVRGNAISFDSALYHALIKIRDANMI